MRSNPTPSCWTPGSLALAGAGVFVAGMATHHVLILPLVARFAPSLLGASQTSAPNTAALPR